MELQMNIKKFLMSATIVLSAFFATNLTASVEEYNKGFGWATQIKDSAGANAENVYASYMESILRPCTNISGDVFHAGDARLPAEKCYFTLGAYNAYHGKNNPMSSCVRQAIPSDVARPPDLANCSSGGYSTCAAKTFSYVAGTKTPRVTFRAGMPINTVAFEPSDIEGQNCGSTNSSIECVTQAKCTTAGWSEMSAQCNCVVTSGSFNGSDCTGTPPPNTGYCRCAKWVSWERWKSTNEC
jgi:hypothetical protein